MKHFLTLLTCALIIILPKKTFCQDPFYYHYSINNGLPSNNIFYAFQDSKGYMWFGTNAGVSMFDGYNYKNFTTENGLSDNEVFQIHEDLKGRFWFSTMNGELCYYDTLFHTRKNDSLLKNTALNYPILSFLETKDGSIIHGSSKGGAIKITKNQTIRNTTPATSYQYIWEQNSQIYALASSGIIRFSSNFREYEKIYDKFLGPYINRVVKIRDTVYIGQGDSIYLFNENKIIPKYTLQKGEEIISLSYHSDNTLWAGTRNGIFIIDMNKKNTPIKKIFNGTSVSCSFEDREGNVWVTTLENGVYFIPSPDIFLLKDKEKQPDIILKLEKDQKNTLWICKAKNNYSTYSPSGQLENYHLEDNRDLQISNIRHMGEYGTWIAGKENIMQQINNSKLFFPYWSNDVLIDDEKNLWLAASNVMRISYSQWKNSLVPLNDLKESELLGPEDILSTNIVIPALGNIFCRDKKGHIWIGTDIGLYKWSNGLIKKISEQNKLLGGRISDLKYYLNNDELLVATQENGIAILKDDNIKTISKNEGLLSNVCYSVAKDSGDNIWVATSEGLNIIKLNNAGLSVENYSAALGLPNKKINNIQSYGDTIYLATDDGVLFLNSQKTPRTIAPLIRINNVLLRDKTIDLNKTSIFNYNDNAISFTYTGLSYRDQGNITYNYMLEGYDTAWQKTTMREIKYNALAPGEYIFKIVSVNGSGVPSLTPATLSFKILPPFWEKWWFRLITVIFISSIIYLFWRKRVKELQNKFELKQKATELEKEKIKIERDLMSIEQKVLRLQMNPHFIFNALNTIKGYYAENNVQQASEYIGKFSKLIRFILENADSLISLRTEVEILTLYLEMAQIRYKNKFDFRINVAPGIDQSETAIPPMLLQPFVENAIIHGLAPREEKGDLFVQFNIEDGFLICTVTDNGIGLSASKEKNKNTSHNSLATQITEERLLLYETEEEKKCTLEITELTDGSQGTKVEIKLPIKNIWK